MKPTPRRPDTDTIRRRITAPTLQTQSPDVEFIYDPSKKKILKQDRFFNLKLITSIVLFFVIIVTFVATKIFSLGGVIVSNDNPVELDKKLDTNSLGTEASARINILLLGVGDSNHAGADL